MSNNKTPDLQPFGPRAGLPYMLIPFLGLTLLGLLIALGAYIRRRQRIDELRHKLIPLYSYDPTEQDLDSEEDSGDEDDELTQPLRDRDRDFNGQLSFGYNLDH
ncbi:small integral membrane protein 29-like [Megalops cyprinoides]|uniref:small integral membrane protein 29-like n=1 Tax=Megalops cyprinoides TaxID=118141 RepID=UPI001864A564|nr:small integral membrane protein 29-like [Megalops cyprinoides]